MKLSNLTAKLTCMKRNAVRILSVAALAGATLAVAAPAAQAQQFGVAVRFGNAYPPAQRYFDNDRRGFYAEGRYWQDRRAYDNFCRQRDSQRFRHDRDHDRDRYGWR